MTRVAACAGRVSDSGFSREEVDEAVEKTGLLTLEIELTRACDFRCAYCHAAAASSLEDELSEAEIRDVVLQAKDLGARKIIIRGGEPTLYPKISEMVRFIRARQLQVELLTNGSRITADLGRELFEQQVRVVLKMNSLDQKVQDSLTGRSGSFELVQAALGNLRQAGYPSEKGLLAVSTLVCRQNVAELPSVWSWLRERGIAPCLEIMTPRLQGKEDEWAAVDSEELRNALAAIADIDRMEYGEAWEPHPALFGGECMRHKFSCLVCSQGDVMPCVGVDTPIGNVRTQKLCDIIKDSEIILDLKDHINTIKGPCRSCDEADVCYGCRGAAYQLTGDYLASDPTCRENADRQEEIVHLPFAVAGIIPQQLPMRVIDTLVGTGERSGEVSVTVSAEMPFVGEDGILDEVAYFEMMAQSMAALNGFKQLGASGASTKGYLVGAHDVKILGTARVGDTLRISVYKDARFAQFGIIRGTVSRDDALLARGELKIWHDSVIS